MGLWSNPTWAEIQSDYWLRIWPGQVWIFSPLDLYYLLDVFLPFKFFFFSKIFAVNFIKSPKISHSWIYRECCMTKSLHTPVIVLHFRIYLHIYSLNWTSLIAIVSLFSWLNTIILFIFIFFRCSNHLLVEKPPLQADVSFLSDPDESFLLHVRAVTQFNESDVSPPDGITFSYFHGSLVNQKCKWSIQLLLSLHCHFAQTRWW